METYLVAPDDCLILRAFKDAGSMREAARLLGCDPAGLMHKVQRIARDHGYLQKVEGRWRLSASGRDLVAWTEETILSQRKLLQSRQTLRIATMSWFAEQALIPNLPALRKLLGGQLKFSLSTPVKSLEQEVIEGGCDFMIVCHPPEDPAIAHKQVGPEDWVMVVPAQWGRVKREELRTRPYVRHLQFNPNAVIPDLNPQFEFEVDNLVGVRAAVLAGLGWSFVPRILVADLLRAKKLAELDSLVKMDRKVCVWWLRSRREIAKQAPVVCGWVSSLI